MAQLSRETQMNSPEPTIESTPLTTHYGNFDLFCFSWSGHEEDNVLALVREPLTSPCLTRIQSACYTGEIFSSTDCDCHDQLDSSLRRIQESGGVFIYLLCDGRGAGLLSKVRALALNAKKQLDTAEAYRALGIPLDPRTYERAAHVLRYLNVQAVRLLTNNPRKLNGLKDSGFDVIHAPLEIPATASTAPYLKAKALKLGHMLQQFKTGTASQDSP